MTIQWSLVLFTMFVGLGAWLFVFVAIDQFLKKAPKAAFPASLIALVAIGVGGVCSVFHLGHPERIFAALTHPGSGIFLEFALLAVLAVCIVVFMILVKREQGMAAKVVAIIGAVAGIALAFAMGASYIMEARPSWDTPMLAIAYGLTALPMGAATWLWVAASNAEDAPAVGKVYGMALLVSGVLAALAVILFSLAGGLMIVALIAALAAAVLGFLATKGNNVAMLALIAAACALIGAVCFRCGMWELGTGIMHFFGVI